MELTLFNKEIDYQGQDLHMLRNNKEFPLHLFFNSNLTLSYMFRLNGEHTQDVTYEQIEIKITGNNEKVIIKANPYIPGTDVNHPARVDNFFITVKSNNPLISDSVILLHLHDEIDKAWTSPNTLSLRKGMELKFGVLVSFTDGNYGDLSFYPETKKNLINGTTYLNIPIDPPPPAPPIYDPKRLTWKANPPANVNPIIDAIAIELPPWMANNGSSNGIQVTGSVRFLDEFGNLKFHKGNIDDIDARMNILFLSDGFKNNTSNFHKTIDQFSTELLKKETYTPWNLLGDRLNIWSYYTDDQQEYSSLESEHIFIRNASSNSPTIIELYSFISLFDTKVLKKAAFSTIFETKTLPEFKKYLIDFYSSDLVTFLEIDNPDFDNAYPFIKKSNGAWFDEGKYVTLSDLCSRVGLPSQYNDDLGSLNNNLIQWNKLGWITDVTTDPSNSTKKYIHPYVFKIWKKLKSRIYLEKMDTSYGVTNTFLKREIREVFEPTRYIGAGTTKFPPTSENAGAIVNFGSYINKITDPIKAGFGQIFFDQNGIPELGKDKNEYIKQLVKPSDNIILLSRVRTNGVYGTNQILSVTVKLNEDDPGTDLSLHRTVASIEAKIATSFKCKRTVTDDIYRYEQDNLDVKETRNQVKNTIVHEFSHNYLRDEYSAKFGDLNQDATERTKLKEVADYSNLEIGKDLETQTHYIDASKIKWRWPRIRKIGLGIVDQPVDNIKFENNAYSCIVQTNAININDNANSFEVGDRILLRKRFLFDKKAYIQATVTSSINEVDYKQKITFSSSNQITTSDYDDGFIIVLPFWRTDSSASENDFQYLIHHEVENAISQANYFSNVITKPGRPMVFADDRNNNRPQNILKEFLDTSPPSFKNFIANAEKNKSKVVGLYAGGLLSYFIGIYHPTGFCTMRGFVGEDREDILQRDLIGIEKAKLITSNSFCPVCSYILIDYIDPLKHPSMDVKYGNYI